MLYKIQLRKNSCAVTKSTKERYSRWQLYYSAVFLGGASPEAVRTKETIKKEFLQNCYWFSLLLGDEFREKREASPKENAGLLKSLVLVGMLWHKPPRKTFYVRDRGSRITEH